MLHPEAGYEAVGIPNVVVSMLDVDVAVLTAGGTSGRYTPKITLKVNNYARKKTTYAPKPNKHPRHIHLNCPHPTARTCKPGPVAIRFVFCDDAPAVQRTVALQHSPTLALHRVGGDGAPWEGVQRDLVVPEHVDTLDDVDFATVGPGCVGAECPEGGPDLGGEVSGSEEGCIETYGATVR